MEHRLLMAKHIIPKTPPQYENYTILKKNYILCNSKNDNFTMVS